MAKFPLTEMAVNMYCPGNVVQLDDAGLPSLLVWIPAFKNSDVLNGGDDSIHPAFIVNGVQIPGFYYSKYQNVVHNGKAYSLPAEDPQTSVTFDRALEYCEAKGYGWHMCTNAEWAAIALWCKKNGFFPHGNNYNGKDVRETDQKAIATNIGSNGLPEKVATGTGPLEWSHDKTASGIWDMNGNGWEWQAGIRIVWGEIQILANNDAADPDNPQNTTSTCWKAINAADGALVDPESKTTDTAVKTSGSTVKLDYVNSVWTFSTGVTSASTEPRYTKFGEITCDETIGTASKIALRALALLPDEGGTAESYDNATVQVINGVAERYMTRGGVWYMQRQAGVFHFNLGCTRTAVATVYGTRAAYIPNI